MSKYVIVLCMLCMLYMSGCGWLLTYSESELQDLEKTRVIARNYLEIADMQIGFIKGSMGERISEMPTGTLDAMNELHDLSISDPNSHDDFSLGYSLGLRVRITNDIVRKILERYAPEILRYWP